MQKRVKTPTILQMEATECGSAALSIILAYYKKYLTPEEARVACGVSRNGTKAINIVKAARHYGMDAYGVNLDIDELDTVKVPFIAYWQFDHFIIVEGYSKSTVYINDPATGPRTITWKEFEESFTGVVLALTPDATFQRGGRAELSTPRLMLERLGYNYLPILFIMLITLFLIVPKIATPIFTKVFIDQILIDNQKTLLGFILLCLGFCTLTEMLLTWIQIKFLFRLNIKLDIINSINYIWHLLHNPMRFFQQRASGDIVERSLISGRVAEIIARDFPILLVELLEVIAYSVVIFIISWQIGAVVSSFILLNLFILQTGKKRLNDTSRRYAQDKGKLEGTETNGIQMMETIKVSALESYFFNRWIIHYTKFLTSEQQLWWISSVQNIVPNFLNLFINLTVIIYGVYLAMRGYLSIGSIVAIQALINNLLKPIDHLIDFLSELFQLKGDIIRLKDVVDTPIDATFLIEDAKPNPLFSHKQESVLHVDNVSFSYSPLDPPIVDELSLTIKRGETVAIVGTSGSGKTTLAHLICALDLPTQGEMQLNTVPYSQISRESLSEYIAYVDQNPYLFSGTIKDNLTLWNDHIPDSEILNLLKKVNMLENVIARGGLNARLSDRGANFSSGECQRLEIVRALLKKPQLLILDEATSTLDPELEKLIFNYLKSLNYTTIIIAHRLATIRDCDHIYVMNDGQIAEHGTHESLLQTAGLYNELIARET